MAMQSLYDLKLEIVFQDSVKASQTSLDLLQDLIEAWLVLMKKSFELGQRNANAEQSVVECEHDLREVAEEVMGAQSFKSILDESFECTELLIESLSTFLSSQQVLDADRQIPVSEHSADITEEPKDISWQLIALTHSLECEKAWNQELERRNKELEEKMQLLLNTKDPLSSAIIQTLQGFERE
mgnify:CR=1 FL=1